MHEMHEEWEIKRSYQVIWDKKRPKIIWIEGFEREECVWEVKRLKSIKRDQREMKKNRTEALHRNFINLNRSRGVENLLSFKGFNRSICRACVQGKRKLDGSTNYWASIKHVESFLMDWEAIKNAIKSTWRVSIDSLAVERCPAAVEIA